MTTTPTYWISGSYQFERVGGNVDILATPDDGFRVDVVGSYVRRDVYQATNEITPFGDKYQSSSRLLYDTATGNDAQTALLSNGGVGLSYIAVPGFKGRGTIGYAVAVVDDHQVVLSKGSVDCETMYEAVSTSDGGMIALWGQIDARNKHEVVFRRVGANGNPVGGPVQLFSPSGSEQTNGIMTELTNGTVVIGWDNTYLGGSTSSLYVQLYSQSGYPASNIVSAGDHRAGAATAVQALAGGGFVVAWDDDTADHSTLQLYAADGTTIGGQVGIAGDLTGAITALDDGGFVLGLTEGGSAVVQRFDAAGTAIGDALAGSGQLATLDDGRFVVANTYGYTIYDPREAAISGTDAADVIYGRLDGSEIFGMQGNDTLTGSAAVDIIHGGDGDDRIQGQESDDDLSGSSGNDAIGGGRGNDRLDGGAGDDSLNGSYDDDVLVGGSGADTLRGGSGADVFVYGNARESGPDAATRDVIVDFEVRRDRIDLHVIDADRLHAGQQAFTFIGTAAFTDVGQLRYEVQGGVTLVEADLNGDGEADMTIALNGNIPLNSFNFILTETAAPTAGGAHPFLSAHAPDASPLLHLA